MDRPAHRDPKGHGLSPRLALLLTATSILAIFSLIFGLTLIKSQTIRVGTGVPGGTLERVTPTIVGVLNAEMPPLRFEIVASEGTNVNMEGLREGILDMAIIYEGIKPRVKLKTPVKTLARLYGNPLHVIATVNSRITELNEITKDHRIAIPSRRVASYKRAIDVLNHYGIRRNSGYMLVETENFEIAAHLLVTEQVDMAFFGGAIPIPAIENRFVPDATRFRFIPVGAAAAIALRRPEYTAFTIPAMSYIGNPAFPERDIVTISSVASLVGRSGLEDELGESATYRMVEALFESRSYLVNKHPYLKQMSMDYSRAKPEYPLFVGAADYYDHDKPIVWDMVGLYVSSAFSLIFLVLTIVSLLAARKSSSET